MSKTMQDKLTNQQGAEPTPEPTPQTPDLTPEEGGQIKTPEGGDEDDDDNEPEKKYSDDDVNAIVAKQKAKWEKQKAKEVSEAEKLAQMNAEEKAAYELEQREAKIAERESEISRRELQAEAKAELANRSLPLELADLLDYETADTVKESMAGVEKVFRSSVEAEVNKKLKGTAPTKGPASKSPSPWDKAAARYKKKE